MGKDWRCIGGEVSVHRHQWQAVELALAGTAGRGDELTVGVINAKAH